MAFCSPNLAVCGVEHVVPGPTVMCEVILVWWTVQELHEQALAAQASAAQQRAEQLTSNLRQEAANNAAKTQVQHLAAEPTSMWPEDIMQQTAWTCSMCQG